MSVAQKVAQEGAKLVGKLLFPERCPGCGCVRNMDEKGFCERCESTVTRVVEPICGVCGKMLVNADEEYCALCKKVVHEFKQNKSGVVYSGAVKQAMYAFKYNNDRWIGDYFAKYMVLEHEQWLRLRRPEVIIPVPMYQRKQRKRGYNQALVLAQSVSKAAATLPSPIKIPVAEPVIRMRDTIPQKQLSGYVRRKNLKRAFKMKKNVVKLLTIHLRCGRTLFDRVLVIDDIYTTGATLDAIATVLRESGYAREVYAMTAAIGANAWQKADDSA